LLPCSFASLADAFQSISMIEGNNGKIELARREGSDIKLKFYEARGRKMILEEIWRSRAELAEGRDRVQQKRLGSSSVAEVFHGVACVEKLNAKLDKAAREGDQLMVMLCRARKAEEEENQKMQKKVEDKRQKEMLEATEFAEQLAAQTRWQDEQRARRKVYLAEMTRLSSKPVPSNDGFYLSRL